MSFSGKIKVDIYLGRPNRPSIYLGEKWTACFQCFECDQIRQFHLHMYLRCVHYPMARPIKVLDVQLLLEIDRYVLSFFQESFFLQYAKTTYIT